MTSKTLRKWLEKVFVAEVANEQISIPSKQSKFLVENGFLEEYLIKYKNLFLTYHRLTHKGYYEYCSKC